MNDPHVDALRYRLVSDADYSNAAPLDETVGEFRLRIEDKILRVEMLKHYPDEASARAAVEPYLRTWEIFFAVDVGRPGIAFTFEHADVVDREPPPSEPGIVHIHAATFHATSFVGADVNAVVLRKSYPEPPKAFVLGPDVEAMGHRWDGCLAGREPLPAMAYFCLTVVESHGGRSAAATRFGISQRVLGTLGRLASEAGGPSTARKATGTLRLLTGHEHDWMREAVRLLIRRSGEVVADPRAADVQLTMANLPDLPPVW